MSRDIIHYSAAYIPYTRGVYNLFAKLLTFHPKCYYKKSLKITQTPKVLGALP